MDLVHIYLVETSLVHHDGVALDLVLLQRLLPDWAVALSSSGLALLVASPSRLRRLLIVLINQVLKEVMLIRFL
ncbi:MAG: hypothetical protein ACMG6E_09290 [Candidatus Roizmanbacteria bacterium]